MRFWRSSRRAPATSIAIGNDTFFATNYTKAELEALPDFDEKTVRKSGLRALPNDTRGALRGAPSFFRWKRP